MSEKYPARHFNKGNPGNVLPSNRSQLKHIFGDRDGHITDASKNRQLLVSLANEQSNFIGHDHYGNDWFAKYESDGSQLWVVTRDGVIQNGGRNKKHQIAIWDDVVGLTRNPVRGKLK